MRFLAFILFLSLFTSEVFSQNVKQGYGFSEKKAVIPKTPIQFGNTTIVPISIIKGASSDIGLIYIDSLANIAEAYRFSGSDKYVINQIIQGQNGNLLIAAEGYSKNNQESFYFMEFNSGKVLNSFVFNEGGNELDPFSIVETSPNIVTVTGFVKNREMVGNFDFPIYKEDQYLYLGSFQKTGKKIWSIGVGFPKMTDPGGIKMEKLEDNLYVLGYGKKDSTNVSLVLKTDAKGKVLRCKSYEIKGAHFTFSNMLKHNGELWLSGISQVGNRYELILCLMDQTLSPLTTYSIPLEGAPLPGNINIVGNRLFVSSSIRSRNSGTDNFLAMVDLSNRKYKTASWGNNKIERLYGSLSHFEIGGVLNPNLENASSVLFYEKINWEGISEKTPSTLNIQSDEIRKVKIFSKFKGSSINKGVSPLNCENFKNSIIGIK